MSYDNLVKSKVKQAFRLIGDLADTFTLTHRGASFNFTTASVVQTSPVSTVIKGLLVVKTRQMAVRSQTELGNTKEMSIVFNAQDLDDPTIYDTITSAKTGEIYRMVPPYKNDGYLITVTVTKEA